MAASSIAGAVRGQSRAPDAALIRRNDESVTGMLKRQITDPKHRYAGNFPDETGLYFPGTCSGQLDAYTAAFVTLGSKFHKSPELFERIRLAAACLLRMQNQWGNVDLPITNFNSPPDTGFVTHGAAGAAAVANKYGAPEIFALIEPFLRKAGGAMAEGGVHTPNHRWVICEALAQIHELMPDSRYTRRIDQWLAEGIDIDADGQYNERSTTVYNAVTNKALVVAAHKLRRPELLEPVRRNLDAMLYLLHADGEVVTEISVRQDQNQRGDMGRYWFPLRYMAIKDGDGRLGVLARRYEEKQASLTMYLQYPEILAELPAAQPLPQNFVRVMPAVRVARVRRGSLSATVMFNGSSRILAARKGACVVEAVRFASAFFGKGQFAAQEWAEAEEGIRMTQSLEGPYYQPVEPPQKVDAQAWGASRRLRRQTEVCRLRQQAVVRERPGGGALEISAEGTDGVPLTVEITLRPGGKLEGCEPVGDLRDAMLLKSGYATYRVGADAVRFGPGFAEHSYVEVRGAQPRLPGLAVYLCGFTPLKRTVEFEFL
jgi:hypothetical protein